MSEARLFPEWRDENESTRYPFALGSTLDNGTAVLVEGTLLDAALYPVGGGARLYLSRVSVDHAKARLYVGDDADPLRCVGEFDLVRPPDAVRLSDKAGRPAGLLVSEGRRLALFGGFGVGDHAFTPDQTEFAASVCFPTPEPGVRGVLLDDGTLLTGEVWLVGADGVVFRRETVDVPSGVCGGGTRTLEVIRMDVVGDPLFRRRLCTPNDLFSTPRYLQTVTFKDARQSLVCVPNAFGDVKVTVNNALAADTVLRVTPTGRGNRFEVVGSSLESVR